MLMNWYSWTSREKWFCVVTLFCFAVIAGQIGYALIEDQERRINAFGQICSILINIAALYFLRKTFIETERSSQAAIRSADAAMDTSRFAMQSMRADRAWLFMQNCSGEICAPVDTQTGDEGPSCVLVRIDVSNLGHTPAHSVSVTSEFAALPYGDDEPMFQGGVVTTDRLGAIGPANKKQWLLWLTQKQTQTIADGSYVGFLKVEISYNDVFALGEPRHFDAIIRLTCVHLPPGEVEVTLSEKKVILLS